jgi:hypothetical protein
LKKPTSVTEVKPNDKQPHQAILIKRLTAEETKPLLLFSKITIGTKMLEEIKNTEVGGAFITGLPAARAKSCVKNLKKENLLGDMEADVFQRNTFADDGGQVYVVRTK